MKPDTYFRLSGRPPCTASIARVCRNCGYYAKVRRRTIDQGWHVAEWGECRKADLTETGLMTSENGTCEEFTPDPRRWPNQTPCTQNDTASNASDSQHESSSEHSGGTLRTTAESSTAQPFAGSVSATSLRGASASPSWSERESLNGPNTCTVNATDASGSELPLTSSSSATDAGNAKQSGDISEPLTHGATVSVGSSSSPQRRRGRPRKSPAGHE